MCIAIVKPKGVENLTKDRLKMCWTNNPDGAGFMFNDGQNVYGYKGFMKFKDFWNTYTYIDRKFNLKNKDVVIHFRIATHGGINKQCTHPFPVSTNIEDLKQLYFKSNAGFAHNGILSGWGDNKNQISDSMEYCTEVLANIKYLDEQEKLIDILASGEYSRFALLFPNKFIIGGTWVEDDGIYYSNSSYKERPVITVSRYYSNEPTTYKNSYLNDYNYKYYEDDYYKNIGFVDSGTKGHCDFCGAYGELYTDDELFICENCKNIENDYTNTTEAKEDYTE